MILILVIAFFVLGCSFSCSKKKENFALQDCMNCLDINNTNMGQGKHWICSQRFAMDGNSDEKKAEILGNYCTGCSKTLINNNYAALEAAAVTASNWGTQQNCDNARKQMMR